MAYDKALDQFNLNLQTSRQQRNYGYAQADFAGAARAKDPLGAAGLGSRDAAFAAALAANARQSGQTDLFGQVNAAYRASNTSPGAQIGDVISNGSFNPFENKNIKAAVDTISGLLDIWNLIKQSNFNQANGGARNSTEKGAQLVFQAGSHTFNLDPGLTAKVQQYIDEQDKQTQKAIEDMIQRYYGG
jgi:hypothetical protein